MGDLRIGIIGAGMTAEWHLRAYRKLPGIRIVAIANRQSERGRLLARRYGIARCCASAEELVAGPALDAVDLCVPTAQHFRLVQAVLNRGMHCYVEKPLCSTAAEAADIVARNRRLQRIVFNGFNYRFLPEFCRLQRLLTAGAIGQIRYLRCYRTTMEPPGTGLHSDPGIDIFREFHCHFFDLLYFLGLNDPVAIYAAGAHVGSGLPNPDVATVGVHYGSGALAELTVTVASPGVAPELTIIGDRGSLTLRYGKIRVIPRRATWSLASRLTGMFAEALTVPWRVLRNPFLPACRHFCDCLNRGAASPCDALAAWRVLRLAELAGDSWRERRPLTVPDLTAP